MEAKATHKSVRVTARKARLIRGLICGQSAEKAIAFLMIGRRAASVPVIKLIKSALAQLSGVKTSDVLVSDLVVNEGPRRTLHMPRAQGRATPILKKTSHLTIKLTLK